MTLLRTALICLALAVASSAAAQQPAPEAERADQVLQEGEDPEEREFEVPAPTEEAAPPPTVVPAIPADPKDWWKAESRAPVRLDPLGGRRARRNDPKVSIDNAVPPLLYRLWGLPPLQTMVLRPGETVLEVWVRPTGATQEAIVRVTVRRDNKVFLQARAGMGCCRPEIARRIDIDQELDADPTAFKALAALPVWTQPREVEVKRTDTVDPVCIRGSGYDVTLLQYDRSAHLRRICDLEAVGQIAPILRTVLAAAVGKDPRIDVLFRGGVDFQLEQSEYENLLATGGRLAPKPFNR